MTDKICKNCKHFKKINIGDSYYYRCYHGAKEVKDINLVSGRVHKYFTDTHGCEYQRISRLSKHCGPEGRFYEEKKFIWFKIL